MVQSNQSPQQSSPSTDASSTSTSASTSTSSSNSSNNMITLLSAYLATAPSRNGSSNGNTLAAKLLEAAAAEASSSTAAALAPASVAEQDMGCSLAACLNQEAWAAWADLGTADLGSRDSSLDWRRSSEGGWGSFRRTSSLDTELLQSTSYRTTLEEQSDDTCCFADCTAPMPKTCISKLAKAVSASQLVSKS